MEILFISTVMKNTAKPKCFVQCAFECRKTHFTLDASCNACTHKSMGATSRKRHVCLRMGVAHDAPSGKRPLNAGNVRTGVNRTRNSRDTREMRKSNEMSRHHIPAKQPRDVTELNTFQTLQNHSSLPETCQRVSLLEVPKKLFFVCCQGCCQGHWSRG